jgi:hypothetical protein
MCACRCFLLSTTGQLVNAGPLRSFASSRHPPSRHSLPLTVNVSPESLAKLDSACMSLSLTGLADL